MRRATCDLLALFLLSAASLAFEVNLTRLFSVAQFYHFAFMTVSLALLGFGASGTFLSLAGGRIRHPERALTLLAWTFALTAVGSYGLTQALPFDSFRVALDPRQWGILALHYVALSLPFFCAGAATGLLLSLQRGAVGRTYAANLAGSGLGCLLAVVLPSRTGAEGMVLLTAGLGGLSALLFSRPRWPGTLLQLAAVGGLWLTAFHLPPVLEIRLSPYKGLSYALLYPDSRLLFRAWNGISRVDVVESSLIRSLPGQGIACRGQPPPQRALFVDGDDLSPITHVTDPAELAPLTDCLLTALPYRLRPGARALVLDPRGGWDLWVALAEGARSVTAVEPNPLVVAAVRAQGAWAGNLYDRPDVALFVEDGRAFLARAGPEYDVILMALPAPYHPVTSGAYSLAENYRYTVEGFVAAMRRLTDGGLFGVVRWTQSPPSEEVRAFALAVEAVERTGGDPAWSLVALRSYNQVLILARRGPFTAPELAAIRQFAAARSLDLVYAPDIRPEEANRYNVMPTPEHYLAFVGLMEAEDRARWLAAYPFDVAPPTDDRPFFGHFFRWRQVPEVLAMAGHVWQPFGGAGYLVPLALLGIAVVAAGALILLPLAGRWNGIYPVQDGMNPGLRGRINPALQDRAGEWNGIYPVQDGMNPGLRGRINPALQDRAGLAPPLRFSGAGLYAGGNPPPAALHPVSGTSGLRDGGGAGGAVALFWTGESAFGARPSAPGAGGGGGGGRSLRSGDVPVVRPAAGVALLGARGNHRPGPGPAGGCHGDALPAPPGGPAGTGTGAGALGLGSERGALGRRLRPGGPDGPLLGLPGRPAGRGGRLPGSAAHFGLGVGVSCIRCC
jgi:spermidine synthase